MYRDLYPFELKIFSNYYLDNIGITTTEFLSFRESGG
jgi:hypothetical protein